MSLRTRLSVNAERLWDSIAQAGEIGALEGGGVRRLALSDTDHELRDLFVQWCTREGYSVTIDRMGNIFARRPGRENDTPGVAVGSHLDSVVAGGRFDGVLGVLAGLEILRTLDDEGIETCRPVEVISWTNEEGARFEPPMMGSAVFAGVLDERTALATTDAHGTAVGEELRRISYAGSDPPGERSLSAYFELHIEQGPELDRSATDVGVVIGGFAATTHEITLVGETAHAGPTPMADRRNALVGAGHVICAVDRIGRAHGPDGRSTPAAIEVWPNMHGIVPSRAVLRVDLRHADAAVLDQMVAELHDACAQAERDAQVEVTLDLAYEFGGLQFDSALVATVLEVAADLGVRHRTMLSKAGHDAYHMTACCPTVLIFCPCDGGITHHPRENVQRERVTPSVDVMLNAVLERAQQ